MFHTAEIFAGVSALGGFSVWLPQRNACTTHILDLTKNRECGFEKAEKGLPDVVECNSTTIMPGESASHQV